MKAIRPKFENPPLIERAISVVFEPLTGLSVGDYGLFWAQIIDEFPCSESMQPVSCELESFGKFQPAANGIQILAADALPRAAFRNRDVGELVQVQADRFGFNWIKTGDDHRYPHSEATLDRFFELFEKFERFVADRKLGELKITQCELTNVNVIPVTDVGESFADVGTVIRMPGLDNEIPELRLESQLVGSKHVMTDSTGAPIGRVHAVGQPTLRISDQTEVYRLDIVARGAPLGVGVTGARAFFSIAVSAVNAIFLASVTLSGRRFWGEKDG